MQMKRLIQHSIMLKPIKSGLMNWLDKYPGNDRKTAKIKCKRNSKNDKEKRNQLKK